MNVHFRASNAEKIREAAIRIEEFYTCLSAAKDLRGTPYGGRSTVSRPLHALTQALDYFMYSESFFNSSGNFGTAGNSCE
jgi:hypothetical protein